MMLRSGKRVSAAPAIPKGLIDIALVDVPCGGSSIPPKERRKAPVSSSTGTESPLRSDDIERKYWNIFYGRPGLRCSTFVISMSRLIRAGKWKFSGDAVVSLKRSPKNRDGLISSFRSLKRRGDRRTKPLGKQQCIGKGKIGVVRSGIPCPHCGINQKVKQSR